MFLQEAGVKRPLMSVGKMLAAGKKVYFEDKKGKVVPLRRAGNVSLTYGCEDRAWVLPGRAEIPSGRASS